MSKYDNSGILALIYSYSKKSNNCYSSRYSTALKVAGEDASFVLFISYCAGYGYQEL